MTLLVGVSLLLLYRGVLCDQVTQSPPYQTVASGSKVTLFCTYHTTYSNPDLYWYRIRPDRSFQFILYRDNTRSKDADFTQGRFWVWHSQSQKTFHLVISVEPEDSATYYCARRLSGLWLLVGYPNDAPLIFGAGTRLVVEPKSQPPATPSVFIMRNGTTVACLVKDFYPKDIDIKLESTKKLEEFDPAIVVSPSGKYSAVKLGRYEDPNSVTCSVAHNSKVVSSTNFEPRTNSSGTVKPKPTETENIKLTPKSISEPKATVHHSSQFTAGNVNMLSLTVLGLRMVFAKSLAINFLLTAKLFFF